MRHVAFADTMGGAGQSAIAATLPGARRYHPGQLANNQSISPAAALAATQHASASAPSGGANRAEAGASLPPAGAETVQAIPLHLIRPSPYQSRKTLNPDELEELAASIRQHGVLQPIKVIRRAPDERCGEGAYELVFGERRWQAAMHAGLETIPAIVCDHLERSEQMVQGLVENLHRAELIPTEILAGLKALAALTGAGWAELAPLVGKSRRSLYYYRSLDQMPAAVQDQVAAGELSMKQVRALSILEDPDTRRQLAEAAIQGRLSGAALETVVQSVRAGEAAQSALSRAASRPACHTAHSSPYPEPLTGEPAPAADLPLDAAPSEACASPGVEVHAPAANPEKPWALTIEHRAAMVGLSEAQRAELEFEARERRLDAADTRHAAAVMRCTERPAGSAGAAVIYAQALHDSPLFEPFQALDAAVAAIAAEVRGEEPRAVRTVALAFLSEKQREMGSAVALLRQAETQARTDTAVQPAVGWPGASH